MVSVQNVGHIIRYHKLKTMCGARVQVRNGTFLVFSCLLIMTSSHVLIVFD